MVAMSDEGYSDFATMTGRYLDQETTGEKYRIYEACEEVEEA